MQTVCLSLGKKSSYTFSKFNPLNTDTLYVSKGRQYVLYQIYSRFSGKGRGCGSPHDPEVCISCSLIWPKGRVMSPSLLLGNVPWECLCVYLVIFCIGCWGFVFLLAEMNVMPSSVPKVIDWHIRRPMPEKICTYIVGLFLGIRCRKLRFLDLVCYRQGLDRNLRVIRHSVVRDNKHPWCPVHTEGICFMSGA